MKRLFVLAICFVLSLGLQQGYSTGANPSSGILLKNSKTPLKAWKAKLIQKIITKTAPKQANKDKKFKWSWGGFLMGLFLPLIGLLFSSVFGVILFFLGLIIPLIVAAFKKNKYIFYSALIGWGLVCVFLLIYVLVLFSDWSY